MADNIIKSEAPFKPLSFPRIGQVWRGDKVTHTEAIKLVKNMQGWAGQFNHREALALQDAMDDLEILFMRVWTEIDQSLTRIKSMRPTAKADKEHRDAAMHYLERWQDHDGL